MIRWEHRVIEIIGHDVKRVQDEIHKMEVLGWELVSATTVKDYYMYYTLFFKRQADDD